MRLRAVLLLLFAMLPAVTWAQNLALPEPVPVPVPAGLPGKGMSMAAVERDYGTPLSRRPPVGGGSKLTPPITRWDYVGYSVFFERDTVIDAVAKDAPAPIVDREGLTSSH